MNRPPACMVSPGPGLASDSTGQALEAVVLAPVEAAADGVIATEGALTEGAAALTGAATPAGQVLVSVASVGTGVGVAPLVFLGGVPMKMGNETLVSWPVTEEMA